MRISDWSSDLCSSDFLSHYFKEHMQLYYEHLQKVRDEGAWEEWIKFFRQGVATVSLEATETARAIVGLREAHRSIITDTFGRAAGNGLRILEGLYKRPYVTVSQIRDRLEISFPPASELVRRFVEADILVEVTGRERYRIYQYTPYIH